MVVGSCDCLLITLCLCPHNFNSDNDLIVNKCQFIIIQYMTGCFMILLKSSIVYCFWMVVVTAIPGCRFWSSTSSTRRWLLNHPLSKWPIKSWVSSSKRWRYLSCLMFFVTTFWTESWLFVSVLFIIVPIVTFHYLLFSFLLIEVTNCLPQITQIFAN